MTASTKKSSPQYPAEGSAKISGDLATGVAAQGAGGGLATCDPTQTACTEGSLSRSATRVSSGGTAGPSSLASPLHGVILQLASNAEFIKLPHVISRN